jgi:Domain of unknown function (DUF4189)
MGSYSRSIGAAVVCATILSGAPDVAVAATTTTTENTQITIPAYAEPSLINADTETVNISPNPVEAGKNITQNFGAMAISSESKIVGSALGDRQAEAVADSLLECQANGGKQCRAILWFQHSWGAIAVANNDSYGSGWGANRDEANGEAIRVCQEWGGEDCHIVHALSTSNASDSGTGGEPSYGCNNPPNDPLPDLKVVGIDRELRASTWQTICGTFGPPEVTGRTPDEFFREEILPAIPKEVTCSVIFTYIGKAVEKIPGGGVALSHLVRAIGNSIC